MGFTVKQTPLVFLAISVYLYLLFSLNVCLTCPCIELSSVLIAT